MISSVFWKFRCPLTAIIAAASIVALANRSADASCGDWLARHASEPADADSVDRTVPDDVQIPLPRDPQLSRDVQLQLPLGRELPSGPCTGPFCERDSQGPVSPPSTPAPTSDREHVALDVLAALNLGQRCLPYATAEAAFVQSGYPLVIEHPPRV